MEAVIQAELPGEAHPTVIVQDVVKAEDGGRRRTNNRSGSAGSGATRSRFVAVAVDLATKAKLTVEDVTCPICWSILYEPTTLPCKHSLCMDCYLQHSEENSLYCPCCRRRLSIWSRNAKKHNELLDEALWIRLKNEFPELITAKENGDDSQGLLSDGYLSAHPVVRDGVLCDDASGGLYEELQLVMKPHELDIENQRLQEEAASFQLIQQLEEDEQKLLSQKRDKEHEDFLFAKKLQKELQEVQQVKEERKVWTRTRVTKPTWRLLDNSSTTCNPQFQGMARRMKQPRRSISTPTNPFSNADPQPCCSNSLREETNVFAPSASGVSPPIDTEPPVGPGNDSREIQGVGLAIEVPEDQRVPGSYESSSVATSSFSFSDDDDDDFVPSSDPETDDQIMKSFAKGSSSFPAEFTYDDVQEEVPIDYDAMEKEGIAFANLREKLEREAKDRALAMSLQRQADRGIDIDNLRGKDSANNYSLRTWKRSRSSSEGT